MRDLIVHMDTGLAEELWSDIYVQIRARLQDDEATLRLVPRTAPMSRLVFERKVRSTYDPIQQLWEPLADEQIVREPTLVFVAAARHILDSTNDEVLAQMDECEQRILLIMGLESLLRQVRTRQNRDYAHSIRQRMQGHASDVQMPMMIPANASNGDSYSCNLNINAISCAWKSRRRRSSGCMH